MPGHDSNAPNAGTTTPPSATPSQPPTAPPVRTPDEQDLLNVFLRDHGPAYVAEWGQLIIDQARAYGDL